MKGGEIFGNCAEVKKAQAEKGVAAVSVGVNGRHRPDHAKPIRMWKIPDT